MTYLVEMPVHGGGRLLLQAAGEVPAGVELASSRTGPVIVKAQEALERSLDQLLPALQALHHRVAAAAPDRATVEFGLVLGAETGVVVAKGTSEVHFTVTLTWNRSGTDGSRSGTDGDDSR